MKKIVLIFGLISGAIAGVLMWVLMSVVNAGTVDFDSAMIWGYATMIIALSLVFFGIKSYRDNNGGRISFLKGLQVGILISLISAVCYAASWELYYPKIGDEFIQKFTAHEMNKLKQSGASEAEIEAARIESDKFAEMYKNFFIRFAISVMEIMPVGIIVTLISAGLLRRKELLPGGRVPSRA